MNKKEELVEGFKKLRKQAGLPYLTEAELVEKYDILEDDEDLEEASKEELLKRFGKNKKTFKKDDDGDGEAEVVDDDEEDDKKSKKEGKKESKKGSNRNDEAITKQKLEANKRVGVDSKVQLADKTLTTVVGDKDDKKGAAIKPAGDDVKATVEAITPQKLEANKRVGVDSKVQLADKKLTTVVGDKDDKKKAGVTPTGADVKATTEAITPTKIAADEFAGAEAGVVIGDSDLLPKAKFVGAVKEAMMASGAMKENLEEGSHTMDETLDAIAESVNDMLKAAFMGPQVRRESLRALVNKSEVRKESMVHELKGETRLGEGLGGDGMEKMYSEDAGDLVATIEQANGDILSKLSEGKY